mgnify:CR=1 FL=1
MMPPGLYARVHYLDRLTLKAMKALVRASTVVFLPVGMLEEHGNHLPLGTDTFAVDGLTQAAAAWLLENDPQLHVLLAPTIPYGIDPIETRRQELFTQAGGVWISRETLKSLVTDIAEHLIRYGFRYIFPISFHGGPDQCLVLAEVCSEIRTRHPGVVMYEPIGYVLAGAEQDVSPGLATLLGRPLTPKEEVALSGSIHASMFETSLMLYLAPEMVDPSYKLLRTLEWHQLYQMPDWPGYIGAAPAHADAEIGGAVLRWRGVRTAALIRRAMDGEDLSSLPRHPKWLAEEAEALGISEAPHLELPADHSPTVDSKPVMFIPQNKLDELAAQREADEDEEDLEDTEVDLSPPAESKPAQEQATPPSSAFETKPSFRPSGADDPTHSD